MTFKFQLAPTWPRLAWLAEMSDGGSTLHITHGPGIEIGDGWFCEAVWAGDFSDANFDQTDLVFGSGARIRNGAATFVSSGTTVDRLISARQGNTFYVSNSLACLLKRLGASLDPTFQRYYQFFGSVTCGLDRYARDLQTSTVPVRFTYFHNLKWDGRELTESEKPDVVSDGFKSFAQYRDFLQTALCEINSNLDASQRQHPYSMVGTSSSGYDSPTVSTLARNAGLREAFTFTTNTEGKADSGEVVIRTLGLKLNPIARETWRDSHLPEVPFVSTDAKGEDVFFHGAQDLLRGRVLLTGFHGDKVWDKNNDKLKPTIVRGDRSGLSMSEYRLGVGYIHCAVPFMGVRHVRDIHAISNSPEMAPWDVGGTYTRPICRRIVEEAGVPRGTFALEKKGSSVLFHKTEGQQSESASEDYQRWLKDHSIDFVKRRRIPPHIRERLLVPVHIACRKGWGIHHRVRNLGGPLVFVKRGARRMAEFAERPRLAPYMFPWAIDRAKQRYATA